MSKKKGGKASHVEERHNGAPVGTTGDIMTGDPDAASPRRNCRRKKYEKELAKLQVELVKLQEWIKAKGLKVVVIFEGRDAAGKGGVIKRITQRLNPRVCRVVALGMPDRAGENAVVLPALRRPSAGCGRDGALRPQLVQPGRRRNA